MSLLLNVLEILGKPHGIKLFKITHAYRNETEKRNPDGSLGTKITLMPEKHLQDIAGVLYLDTEAEFNWWLSLTGMKASQLNGYDGNIRRKNGIDPRETKLNKPFVVWFGKQPETKPGENAKPKPILGIIASSGEEMPPPVKTYYHLRPAQGQTAPPPPPRQPQAPKQYKQAKPEAPISGGGGGSMSREDALTILFSFISKRMIDSIEKLGFVVTCIENETGIVFTSHHLHAFRYAVEAYQYNWDEMDTKKAAHENSMVQAVAELKKLS